MTPDALRLTLAVALIRAAVEAALAPAAAALDNGLVDADMQHLRLTLERLQRHAEGAANGVARAAEGEEL